MFDYVAQKSHTQHGKVFFALCPEYTNDEVREEINAARSGLPEGQESPFWGEQDRLREMHVWSLIEEAQKDMGTTPPYWGANRSKKKPNLSLVKGLYEEKLVRMIQSLPPVKTLTFSDQLSKAPGDWLYHIPNHTALMRVRSLCRYHFLALRLT